MYEVVENKDVHKLTFPWKVCEKNSGKVICYIPSYYIDPEEIAWNIMASLNKLDVVIDLTL